MERAQHATTLAITDRMTHRWQDTQIAVAGFLSDYSGSTRVGHTTELRLWQQWCADHGLSILDDAERAHINMYARELEEVHGRKRSTVAHKLSVIAKFYEYCADEEFLHRKNPAAKIKRPQIEYITTREHLDDGELRRFLAAAAAGTPRDNALCRLLACNALRISEALNTNVEDLSYEGHHRTLKITRKGGKLRRPPISPFVSVAIDQYLNGRTTGPIFLARDGLRRMDRHAASRIVKRLVKDIGVTKSISPHCLRHSAITSLLNAGVPIRDVQHFADHADPRTTAYYDHGRKSLDANPTYVLASFIAGG